MMKPTLCIPLVALCILLIAGCATPQGDTISEQRASIEQMVQDTLAEAYRLNPGLQDRIKRAAGYGVFSNRSSKFLIMTSGHGYGLVRDNQTGQHTYMRMAQVGGGLGMGIRDFRVVFVFQDDQALRRFVNSGWDFGGDMGATAKAGGRGGQASARATVQGIEIYQFTRSGLELVATVAGTRYWQDQELNAGRNR
jgi:lipid-binding SYLF domain-containing protein